jgi:hypothetical protein
MFDLLPDAFSKISLHKALGLTVCFSTFAGVCIGELLIFTLRLRVSTFDFIDMLLQTLLYAALAVRFCFLTLSRVSEQQSATPAR